jgi:peptidoglycan/xylan/chitin deacetylase (PgdA/CDA1 family)
MSFCTIGQNHRNGSDYRTGLRKAVLIAALALSTVTFAACGAADSTVLPATPVRLSPTLELAATATRAATQTPTAELTIEPSSTPVPSFTHTPLPTPLPSSTPTPWPTPEGAERSARVPILMYHHITDLPVDASDAQRDYAVSPLHFEEQLRYLKDQGYQSISLYDLNDHLQMGNPLPDKAVILTFDDGYRDNAVTAFPLLLQYGFTATFLVNTQPINDEYPAYMTWEQVEQMSRQGMYIESHSHSHPNLKGKPVEDVVQEVRRSKELIENHTGTTVRFFSYPYGHYDQQVVDILISQGFWGAVTLRSGLTHGPQAMFDLERVWVRYDDTLDSFAVKLERGW